MKKKIIIITLILIISISIVKLYQTYAISSSVTGDNDNYTVNLNGNTSVVVPANGNKTVYYKIRNTNNGTVRYGIGYKSVNAVVKVYFDSESSSTGLINKEENKFIKLYFENSSSSSETVYLTTILGYENGGNLIVPSGYKLISEFFTENVGAAKKISKIFEDATKEEVINNDVTYQYDTTNSLIQDVAGNLRYFGSSPNNYIYFNCDDYASQTNETCELWRIIGVVDGKLKIMRNEIIGEYSWDNKDKTTGAESDSGSNDWSTARVMKLLNPSDYYKIDSNDNGNGQSLYWNAKSGTCFAGKGNETTDCDFTSTGLKNDTTRNMISENTYYLKSYVSESSTYSVYVNEMYDFERTTGSVRTGRPTSWTGKVAIPYPSDYAYAADLKSCQEKINAYDNCRDNNWMFPICSSDYTWLLTPDTGTSSTSFAVFRFRPPFQGQWYHYSAGVITDGFVTYSAWGVIPTLYLDNNYEISTGNGTSDTPYQLKIENNQQYTITYNANGGNGAPSNQIKKHGENITLSSVKPTKTGYTFTGWNTNSDGSGTGYSAGSTYSKDGDVTLYAQWQINTYTITYNANGGSGAPSNQIKKHGENITLSSVKPTKTGYTFTGWNTSSNGSGTSYSSGGTYSNNSNVTLYAQWQSVSSYTVTVYLQGELIDNYTVVPGNNLNTRFGVSSDEEIRYKTCTNGATINATVGRLNNMTVATIDVTNITSDTVCNLYYTLI